LSTAICTHIKHTFSSKTTHACDASTHAYQYTHTHTYIHSIRYLLYNYAACAGPCAHNHHAYSHTLCMHHTCTHARTPRIHCHIPTAYIHTCIHTHNSHTPDIRYAMHIAHTHTRTHRINTHIHISPAHFTLL